MPVLSRGLAKVFYYFFIGCVVLGVYLADNLREFLLCIDVKRFFLQNKARNVR
jgi:hypothetical protein